MSPLENEYTMCSRCEEKPAAICVSCLTDCTLKQQPIEGEKIKLIGLTQGKFALVDAKNYEMLSKHKWHAKYDQGKWYAARGRINDKGKRVIETMHRLIMNCPDDKQIDHKNHNGLDNRESNLRICTNAENQHNQKPRKGGSSKYKGVSWRKDTSKWTAHIRKDGNLIHIGNYNNEVEAAKAYDIKAKELYSEFACLNLPECLEFTKLLRRYSRTCASGPIVQNALNDAADRLDSAEARLKELLEAFEQSKEIFSKRMRSLREKQKTPEGYLGFIESKYWEEIFNQFSELRYEIERMLDKKKLNEFCILTAFMPEEKREATLAKAKKVRE